MAWLGVGMTLHDRARFAGTILGVVFAVVLAAQQLGILFGLLDKNTMFVDHAGADVWIAAPGTELFQPGQRIPEAALQVARTTPGVAAASPLIVGGGTIKRPDGGSEGLQIVGTDPATWLGGPWNLVAGEREALLRPDTMSFEHAERAKFGGLNLDSQREVNGRLVRVGAFTWGLLPFGPAYTFASLDLARDLLGRPSNAVDFVLVRVGEGQTPGEVAERLAGQLPDLTVVTAADFHDRIVSALLREQLGVSFGTSTSFGLLIGLVIVALSMFTAVIDNLREFGTLKAMGCTNLDLGILVLAQSILYALVGSLIGLFLVVQMAKGIRSPQLVVILPTWLMASIPAVMVVMCMAASVLALRRVIRLEPGMVFR
jgi:putative ABC transport system permease protein